MSINDSKKAHILKDNGIILWLIRISEFVLQYEHSNAFPKLGAA